MQRSPTLWVALAAACAIGASAAPPAQAHRMELDLRLAIEGAIEGQLRFDDGVAVREGRVEAFREDDPDEPIASATTDDEGRFTLELDGLVEEPGDAVRIRVVAGDGAGHRAEREAILRVGEDGERQLEIHTGTHHHDHRHLGGVELGLMLIAAAAVLLVLVKRSRRAADAGPPAEG